MSWRPLRSWWMRILLVLTAGAVVLAGTACGPRHNDLYRLRMCESGSNYHMIAGQYGGAYAFSIYYWHAAGHAYEPYTAPAWYQDQVAQQLLNSNPHGAFPGCSAKLGF